MSIPRNRWLFAAITVAVLLGSLLVSRALIATAPRAERQTQERQARLVEVATIAKSSQQLSLTAYGVVEAAQRVSLSAQVSGVVQALAPNFVPGARVAQGDWLLQIDDRDFRLALRKAQADLAAAEAARAQEQGKQVVARADLELLDAELAASERALMLREPQLRSAQATVDAARAAVAKAELDLQRTQIRAPFAGRVLGRSTAVGAQVGGPGTMVGELVADEAYWVTLMVPAQALRWVELPATPNELGSVVSIHDASRPAAGPWHGRVIQLLDQVEANGRRAQLLVEVKPQAEDGANLLLGSYVEAVIQGRRVDQVYRLDPGWLQNDAIWLVREGRLQRQIMEILHRDATGVVARAELGADAQVMTNVLAGAVDGMRVRTVKSQAVPAP